MKTRICITTCRWLFTATALSMLTTAVTLAQEANIDNRFQYYDGTRVTTRQGVSSITLRIPASQSSAWFDVGFRANVPVQSPRLLLTGIDTYKGGGRTAHDCQVVNSDWACSGLQSGYTRYNLTRGTHKFESRLRTTETDGTPHNFNEITNVRILQFNVTINGPGTVQAGERGTWIAGVSDAPGAVTSYKWYYRYPGASTWYLTGGNSSTMTATFYGDREIKLVVIAGNETDTSIRRITVNCNGGIICDQKAEAPELALRESSLYNVPESYETTSYPNPFNPATEIRVALPEASDMTLEVFDVSGRKVAQLHSGSLPAGYHSFHWDASSFPSGVYIYRMRANNFSQSKNIVLLK